MLSRVWHFADAKTYHTVLRLDRGCSWESALECRNAYIQECRRQNVPPSAKSGFYIDKKKHGKDGTITVSFLSCGDSLYAQLHCSRISAAVKSRTTNPAIASETTFNKRLSSDVSTAIAGWPYILLATEQNKLSRLSLRQFRIQRPNIGAAPQMQEEAMMKSYRRVRHDSS